MVLHMIGPSAFGVPVVANGRPGAWSVTPGQTEPCIAAVAEGSTPGYTQHALRGTQQC